MRIVVDNRIPFLKGLLETFGEVAYLDGSVISRESVATADALIIRTRTICDEKLLAGTNVRFVGTTTIGTDHIDTIWCDQNRIKWANASGCNSGSVMQYIASALLLLSQKHNFSLTDKTLGIVGAGNTGSKVEMMAQALGMRVLINDPPLERVEGPTRFVSLDRLTAEADIISFHVPLTTSGADKTLNLAGADFFCKIKRGSFIINSSRGGVVDEELLVENIKSGIVKGAVVDVWVGEPNLNRELLQLCDIATPHIAGYSLDGKHNASRMILEQFACFFGLEFDPDTLEKPALPEHETIELSNNESVEDQLRKAIFTSYNIQGDDQRLRQNPDSFEHLRNNYWQRREFGAYKIEGTGSAIQILHGLWFR